MVLGTKFGPWPRTRLATTTIKRARLMGRTSVPYVLAPLQ